uniref:Uncharacterized protein n=1 Tax=Oryza rufipogon TaxID=4529 RepID=A0A0E0QN04_ORYRU
MEEEKGMMGKQEKEKVLLQAAYDGNLRLLRSAPVEIHHAPPERRRRRLSPSRVGASRAALLVPSRAGASHRILLRRCLPPHPPASPPPLGSRCRHRRRLTSDLPEQPLVDASAAATDFPGAAFLPPSADIRSIGNYFSVQSPLSGHRVFPNKNLLEEHLLLHQLGTSVCCTKNVIVMYLRNVLFC